MIILLNKDNTDKKLQYFHWIRKKLQFFVDDVFYRVYTLLR